MTGLTPYLSFPGTARRALTFYQQVFGGELVLNTLADFGRAKCVQLAVMVDRGHREVPIRPDFVGKNLPTRRDELVDVRDDGVHLGEMQAR